jgi:hypothetical protein
MGESSGTGTSNGICDLALHIINIYIIRPCAGSKWYRDR